jgi:hypothetical protein
MDIVNDEREPEIGKSSFSLYYRKLNNSDLFASLEKSELEIINSKNYIPIYETYFNLNETNYNSINLNHRFYVSGLSGIVDKNNIQAAVVDTFKSTPESLTCLHKPIFIKFSPLIDPIKYMSGKYDSINKNIDILKIPTLSKFDQPGLPKSTDKNNSAYVDSFFSYLSSQVLHHHDFIHGLDFYGSFNANKNNFYYNVIDDVEYLNGSSFFNKNKGILFDVEDIDEYSFDSDSQNNNDTRNRKNKIKIDEMGNVDEPVYIIHDNFDTLNDELNLVFNTASVSCTETTKLDNNNNNNNNNVTGSLDSLCEVNISLNTNIDLNNSTTSSDSNSVVSRVDGTIHLNKDNDNNSDGTESCSSRSSYTDDEGEEDGEGEGKDGVEDGNDDHGKCEKHEKREKREKVGNRNKNIDNNNESNNESEDCSGSDNEKNDSDEEGELDDDDEEFDDVEDDEMLWATIKNFPVTAIMLEKCEDTLDSLMMQEDEMSEGEWKSALMQVIMTLVTYQKMFGFTHNDLHTNNIMYIYTEKEFLYYHYNKKYYRVPTYNRIFKIIDFGRSIYRYKSKIICSDSFSSSGDAATQYNCEPYFNENKPRLEANFSFDLCRLGCSIFDYFIDNINDVPKICKKEPLAKLIVDWVTDDQNRNILYKTNGEERYPDFKLYKMIARNVHNHTPHAQLSKPIFAAYEFPKKQVKSRHRIINIDKMPSYVD